MTGTRAEYGLLRSVLAAIDKHPALDLQVIITGMHLLRRFGNTAREVRAAGWPIIAEVRMQRATDDPLDHADGLARGVKGIATAVEAARSDAVVVLGDRVEAMAGALAATTTGRVLGHIHGGDVARGDFDEAFRHAITKLAHLHFTATQSATRRVIRMGEASERVFCVGAPGLDDLRVVLAETSSENGAVRYALVAQHAYGRDSKTERRAAQAVLDAVAACGLRRVVICPNSDRGHQGVFRAIEQHQACSAPEDVVVHRSLERAEYLRQLIGARVLVGNSSSGLIEAPLAGTPVVNVGGRQAGRESGGRGVLQADEQEAAIRAAIQRCLEMRLRRGGASVYGDGRGGERIARILAETALDRSLRTKLITY